MAGQAESKSAIFSGDLGWTLYQIEQTREVKSYLAKARRLSEDADVALVLLKLCGKQKVSKG